MDRRSAYNPACFAAGELGSFYSFVGLNASPGLFSRLSSHSETGELAFVFLELQVIP